MIPHDTYQPRWASPSRGISVSRHPSPPLPVTVGKLKGCTGNPAVHHSVTLILAATGMHVKQKVLPKIVGTIDRAKANEVAEYV